MKKPVNLFKNIAFLFKPWWQYGKIMVLFFVICKIILAPISGYFSSTLAQKVIEKVEISETFKEVLILALVYMAISLLCNLLIAINEVFFFRWKKEEIKGKIEKKIYAQALQTDSKYIDDPHYFDSYKLATEEFVSRSSDTMEQSIVLLGDLARFVLFGSLIAVRGSFVFIVVFSFAVFAAFAQVAWSKISTARSMDTVKPRRRTDYLRRLFFNPLTVADMRSTNIGKSLFRSFDLAVDKRVKVYKSYAMKEFFIDFFSSLSRLGTLFAVPVYVAWGVFSGRMEGIGVYATLIAASTSLKTALDGIGWWSSQLVLNAAYAEQVRSFFDYESTIEPSKEGEAAPTDAFTLKINNLSYQYTEGDFQLNLEDFAIAPYEKIAIVGENGAGKTTLTKLLLRFYDPDDGEILVNGKPIKDYNIHALRKRIGVAFQNPPIYALTIRENLTAYTSSADAILLQSMEKVGLSYNLDRETTKEFDETGIVLSGGEAQKLGLSRILHGEYGLLILDEPSSALDPLSEYELTKLIFQQIHTTAIIIAHRLSTIRDADRIYLLSGGKIVERGTHRELMALDGKYAKMFSRQAEGYGTEDSIT